jgi:hypothetical protein
MAVEKGSRMKKQNLLDLARDENGKVITALLKSFGPLQPDGQDNIPAPDK